MTKVRLGGEQVSQMRWIQVWWN